MRVVEQSYNEEVLLTGLVYIDTERPSLVDLYNLPKDQPLNRMTEKQLRPSKKSLEQVYAMMF